MYDRAARGGHTDQGGTVWRLHSMQFAGHAVGPVLVTGVSDQQIPVEKARGQDIDSVGARFCKTVRPLMRNAL